MDEFDKLIKEKIKNEVWELPKNIDNSINDTLNDIHTNKKKSKSKSRNLAAAVALILVFSFGTVFANAEEIKSVIKSTIEFFNENKDSKYLSDKATFDKFNKSIGISTEDNDIKFTVDNIALDDNFLNVFYTIESNKPIEKRDIDENGPWSANFTAPHLQYKINGKDIEIGNHNDEDAYFESDKVLKVMARENICLMNLPKEFKLEVFTKEMFGKEGNWYISTKLNKEEVSISSLTVKPKIKAEFNVNDIKHNVTIDKVSISPFGNQIVLSEYVKNNRLFNIFAILDDKGNSLDVLNTDLTQAGMGKTTNSFEFIKGNIDMPYITLVPIQIDEFDSDGIDKYEIIKDITSEPMKFDLSNQGSIIVNKFKVEDNVIKISYKKEGVTLWDPAFSFYDENGNKLDDDWHCYVDYSVDRKNGTYTAIYTIKESGVDFSKIKKIGTYNDEKFTLLKDQGIKIKLK